MGGKWREKKIAGEKSHFIQQQKISKKSDKKKKQRNKQTKLKTTTNKNKN